MPFVRTDRRGRGRHRILRWMRSPKSILAGVAANAQHALSQRTQKSCQGIILRRKIIRVGQLRRLKAEPQKVLWNRLSRLVGLDGEMGCSAHNGVGFKNLRERGYSGRRNGR